MSKTKQKLSGGYVIKSFLIGNLQLRQPVGYHYSLQFILQYYACIYIAKAAQFASEVSI